MLRTWFKALNKMKESSNLKKSLSQKDVQKLDPNDAPLKALIAQYSSKKSIDGVLSRTACFEEADNYQSINVAEAVSHAE